VIHHAGTTTQKKAKTTEEAQTEDPKLQKAASGKADP